MQHLSSGAANPAGGTGLQARNCPGKRVGKTDSKMRPVCNSGRRLLITSPSVSHKCKRSSGFRGLQVIMDLPFQITLTFFPHIVGSEKAKGYATEWGRFVPLSALMW